MVTALSVCGWVCRDGEPVDMADFVQMYNEDSCESVRYGPISPPHPSFPIKMYTYLCSVCLLLDKNLTGYISAAVQSK